MKRLSELTNEEKRIIVAAANMDWQQVVMNGGPPCFHLEENGRFCGRAKHWEGHDDCHKFISLDALILTIGKAKL